MKNNDLTEMEKSVGNFIANIISVVIFTSIKTAIIVSVALTLYKCML